MLVVSLSKRIECLPEALELVREGWPDWFAWDGLERLGQVLRSFPDTQLLGFEGPELVAVANAVTVPFDRPLAQLPDTGWDWAVDSAGPGPTLVALAVTVAKAHRGRGFSRVMLKALADLRREQGCDRLVVAVRPNAKPREVSFDAWVAQTRSDGLPADPWLRTHVRLGAQVLHTCHRSMSLSWPASRGPAVGLLAPVEIRDGRAHYVEPNVWVVHQA